MLSLRDRTFCCAGTCAKRYECDRFLTKEIEKKAESFGLPLSCVAAFGCFEPQTNEQTIKPTGESVE